MDHRLSVFYAQLGQVNCSIIALVATNYDYVDNQVTPIVK